MSEPELTYRKAFDLAQAVESAERNAQDLQLQREAAIHVIHEKSGHSVTSGKEGNQTPTDLNTQESDGVYVVG